ncbi:MAG: ATP-binding protein [bacterium]
MYIKRKIEDTVFKYINSPEIIAIVGARRSGKTTLLEKIYKSLDDAVFITFEDQKVLNLFEKDIDNFIKLYIADKKYLFIDEFQYSKNGGKILKYIYDLHHIKIFISGSSAIDLTVNALKFLVGRIFVFDLYPFNFEEILSFKDPDLLKIYQKEKINLQNIDKEKPAISENILNKINKYYDEYIIWGGYPRVVLAKSDDEKKEILKNIYNTYFLREVKNILGLVDDYKLANLIKGLALQVGNLIDYSELCNLSGISYPTLKRYLNFLNKTYVCDFVRPFYKNKRTEIVKNPKVYFIDTGLLNYIIEDFRKLDDRPDSGGLLENSLYQQLIKDGNKINYWRTKAKNEIDFIISLEEGKILALEVKKNADKIKTDKTAALFRGKYPEAELIFAYYKGILKKYRTGDDCIVPVGLIG